MPTKKSLKYPEVVKAEDAYLKARRQQRLGPEMADQLDETRFGIALSGGGIRSATINLGLLRTLNKFKVLEKADYLSTVSGGGYTGAYLQSTLRREAVNKDTPTDQVYEQLFKKEHTNFIRSQGEYMMPGIGRSKQWNIFILLIGYVVSTLMSWVSPLIFIFLFLTTLSGIGEFRALFQEFTLIDYLYQIIDQYYLVWIGIGIFFFIYVLHFIFNIRQKYDLGISRKFNQAEAVLGLVALAAVSLLVILNIVSSNIEIYQVVIQYFKLNAFASVMLYVVAAGLTIALGFFANPNSISFHRFYRAQLANAYLNFAEDYKNITLRNLIRPDNYSAENMVAPYPLINTCLNLQLMGGGDANFKGAKASDYFLLSPFYFGSKLTGYVPTDTFRDYEQMTLPAATTISAAAVNPGMGIYSNKVLSILMTVFNVRLGFWVSNPLKRYEPETVWWPWYFFKELFSKIGTANRKLNISDGGHIENLGVYELLRRRCRLIIAVDAGADPTYNFNDLEILTVRARNELGLSIEFRPGHIPEDVIRPKPSFGYSLERYAVADIYHIWDEIPAQDSEGQIIKDENYQPFEVLVNYPNLKDTIKALNYNGKLLVRMIFRVINEFQEVDELRNQLMGLKMEDPNLVKALLETMIFSHGTNARTPGIKEVLTHAVLKEPEKIRPLLQKAGLLSRQFQSGVKLEKRIIDYIINDRLDGGIASIEKILLEEMSADQIHKAYSVMETFLDLLADVKTGVDQKVINRFLLRKIEDEYVMKALVERGLAKDKLEAFFAQEPADKALKAFLSAENMDAALMEKLFTERDEIRKKVYDRNRGSIPAPYGGTKTQNNDLDGLEYLLRKVNMLLNDDDLEPLDFTIALRKELVMVGFTEVKMNALVELPKAQSPKVTQIMNRVSERIEEQVRNDIKASTLVYIKSSVKAPKGKIVTDDETMYGAYKYKIYHPSFPHESTADQFFDPVQWEAYYMLGQYLGAEVLGVSGLDKYLDGKKAAPDFSIGDLLYRFDYGKEDADLFLYNSEGAAVPMPTDLEQSRTMRELESLDPVEEAAMEEMSEKEQPMMEKKVVAGKNVDYTI